jgi:hypothetical protein
VHPGKNTAECLRHETLNVVNAFASMSEWLRAGSNANRMMCRKADSASFSFQRRGDEGV